MIKSKARVKTRNVFIMLVLNKLVSSFYEAYWILTELPSLNKVTRSNKISKQGPILLMILTGLVLAGSVVINKLAYDAINMVRLSAGFLLLLLAQLILLVKLRFHVKGLVEKLYDRITLHPLGVFFFGVYYIQSKINQKQMKKCPWMYRLLPSWLVLFAITLFIYLLIFLFTLTSALV